MCMHFDGWVSVLHLLVCFHPYVYGSVCGCGWVNVLLVHLHIHNNYDGKTMLE